MKYNKIFRVLFIGVIVCLLVIALPATPALAQTILLTPASGTAGTTVSVTGTGFAGHAIVYIFFGYYAYSYVAVATGMMTTGYFTTSFSVPSTATPGLTYVVVRDGPTYTSTALATTPFTVTARQITISPTSGYVGSTVTVNGSGFNPSSSTTIYFDTTAVSTVTTSATGTFSGATFPVPESYNGTHTVKGSDAGGESPGVSFTTSQKITANPTSGAVSDAVSISGTGFAANSGITLYFDNVSVSTGAITTNANGSFTNSLFTIPSSSRGSHTIKAQDASSNYAISSFTITEKMAITPSSGTSGTTVTVSGTGFSASTLIIIKYNTVTVTTNPAAIYTDAKGSFTASFDVPAGVAGTYSVVATDGGISTSASFVATVDATISQTTTEASPGYVGTELTITGTGFKPNATVTITYTTETITLATVTTDANGAFSVDVKIPPSVGGNHTITVTDGYTTKLFTFVMESQAPPIPAPLLPEEGIKAKSETSFDWKDVDDPSGVTYTLWIASEPSFTTTVLKKEGLTSSEYIITEEEKLESVNKKEPYYWSVKAIDGASNESQWAPGRSFYVGFFFTLPTWAIYLLFGIGALLLGVLGFWLGRRSVPYKES